MDKKVVLNNILYWLGKAQCNGAQEAKALLESITFIQSLQKDLDVPAPLAIVDKESNQ